MAKSQIRTIGALVILLMLCASSLSVNYSFAESEEDQEENRALRAILTEKVVNGKLEVRQYVLPEGISEVDLKRTLSFEGQMSWAYVNFKAYQSGIVLFDGKASKMGENLWEISIQDDYSLDDELVYKVVFSGKIAETDEKNVFVVSFMNSMINFETIQSIKILQMEETGSNSEKSNSSNQEFRKSISVK